MGAFQDARKRFVEQLGRNPGVVASHELTVVKGQKTAGLTVGMTVYESEQAYKRIAGEVMSDPAAHAYFSPFTPVAVQYARSVSVR